MNIRRKIPSLFRSCRVESECYKPTPFSLSSSIVVVPLHFKSRISSNGCSHSEQERFDNRVSLQSGPNRNKALYQSFNSHSKSFLCRETASDIDDKQFSLLRASRRYSSVAIDWTSAATSPSTDGPSLKIQGSPGTRAYDVCALSLGEGVV